MSIFRADRVLACAATRGAGSSREARLRALMISDGAVCLGGIAVERVSVDPRQFRAFVAEAVYSWAVAVRTDTLLPPEAEG